MGHRVTMILFLSVLLWSPPGSAQDRGSPHSRWSLQTLHDFPARDHVVRMRVYHGAPNHDYFTAGQDPQAREFLNLVEAFHLNKDVWASFSAGRYGSVLGDVRYVLERFPNHPHALMLLGSVAKLTGELSLPLPYYEKALKLFPQYAPTHAQYGAYLAAIGYIDVGITQLKEAITMDPQLAVAYAWLASAYYQNGNQELARQAAQQARELGYKGKIPGQGLEEETGGGPRNAGGSEGKRQ